MTTDDLIPGIHDYCDRWCERCPFTARCAIGRGEAARGFEARSDEEFAERLTESLGRAMALIAVEYDQLGLDMDGAGVEPLPDPSDHPLYVRARDWADEAALWLAEHGDEDEPGAVVSWYLTIVPSKVYRALSAPEEERRDPEGDPVGTAKVVTLALHRVIAALTDHCAAHPVDRAALDVVVASGELVDAVEAAFPGHMAFRRPGFDDRA